MMFYYWYVLCYGIESCRAFILAPTSPNRKNLDEAKKQPASYLANHFLTLVYPLLLLVFGNDFQDIGHPDIVKDYYEHLALD